MKKGKVIYVFFPLILMLLFAGCSKTKRTKINESLGIKIPNHSSDIEYYKVNRSEDNEKPYNIYIRLKIDSIGFNKIIEDTKLISFKSDFIKKMCLDKIDKSFSKNIWDFNFGNFVQKKIKWWHPDINEDNLLYASFYKEKGAKKIENCYSNDWDGRILLGYNKVDEYVYILIQVYMGAQ